MLLSAGLTRSDAAPIETVLAVEDDVVPADRAHILEKLDLDAVAVDVSATGSP